VPDTLAALLDGELTENAARQAHAHLAGCPACARLHAHLLSTSRALAQAGRPPADATFVAGVMERVAGPSRHPARLWRLLPVAALAAGVGVGLWGGELREARPEAPAGFTARGGPVEGLSRRVGVEVFLHPGSAAQGRRALRAGDTLAPGDGLSFVLTQRSGVALHAMLFAVDARGQVHWFYPAWVEPEDNPLALSLSSAHQVLSLPEGVTPEGLAEGPLEVVALFTPQPHTVREVEALLAGRTPHALASLLPGSALHPLPLRVAPPR
jgi:anti-sigma factor RsiW